MSIPLSIEDAGLVLRTLNKLMLSAGFPEPFESMDAWNHHKLTVIAPLTGRIAAAINEAEWSAAGSPGLFVKREEEKSNG